jgi:FlaA1/EpsC-like NDP-sugar epimerase
MGERSRELTILITGDILCFVVSLYATLLVRYVSIPSSELLSAHIGPFLFLSCIWLFIFYIGGLYDKQTVFLKGILFSRIINTQFVNILIAALIFLIVPFGIAPKTNLVLYLVISIILITLWRLKLYNRF